MYDIHSHIIYGVDDGAASIEESVEMARYAAADGVDVIIATPHYIEGLYINDYEDNLIRLNMIKKELDKAGIKIRIYLGNEVRITPELCGLIKSGKVAALNNSRYILVELPFLDIPFYTEKVLFDLEIEGYKAILAHPERNERIINHPDILYRLIKQGAYVQMSISSIEGKYGKRVRKAALLMLQHHMVHFIGTDSHSPHKEKARIKALSEMLSYYYQDKAIDLLFNNPDKIINNELVRIDEPEKVKKLYTLWKG